jgi:hypothetical protein
MLVGHGICATWPVVYGGWEGDYLSMIYRCAIMGLKRWVTEGSGKWIRYCWHFAGKRLEGDERELVFCWVPLGLREVCWAERRWSRPIGIDFSDWPWQLGHRAKRKETGWTMFFLFTFPDFIGGGVMWNKANEGKNHPTRCSEESQCTEDGLWTYFMSGCTLSR